VKKDKNGPIHQATIKSCKIPGVLFQRSPIVKYEAGVICEIKNERWQNLYEGRLDHIYVIYDDTQSKRDWGMHQITTDRYLLLKGSIEVALFDGRKSGASEVVVFTLHGSGGGDFSGVLIPPGVWHSFRNLDNTELILMNFKHPEFNRDDVDKYRLPMPNELTSFEWTGRSGH